MLRTTIRRTTGTINASHAFTHGLGTTLDFWAISAFGAVGAFRPGYRTFVTAANSTTVIRARNTAITAATIDIVCIVYQGHLY